ncbi:MAG TPA: CoA transferase [Ramlibacter sp.]|nr:CoA transferase [Ramlibacter sp.]
MKPILDGIRIVDMTSVIFGPYCTATLAAMGADVVKIEPPGGDEARRVGRPVATRGMGPLHMTLNAGKRSVTWNLKTQEGRQRFEKIVAKADVFIHNMRPDALKRSRLDYADIAALKPDIVYVHCTGFGVDGPYAGRSAYDDIIQAASGAATLLPRVDGNQAPRFLPMALADKVSGLHAINAVTSALFHRQRTGEGQQVEVPMFECFTHFLLQEHMYGWTFVPPNDVAGYPRQLDPKRQPLRTADGYMVVAPYTDERWVRFFDAVGEPGFLAQHGLNSARDRFAKLDVLQRKMAQVLPNRTTDEWLALFAQHDIPAFRINDLEDVFSDPHLQAVGFFQQRTHATEGDWLQMRQPVRFSKAPEAQVSPAPLLGEHNDDDPFGWF